MVVATCNRFEAYLDLSTPDGESPVEAVHDAVRAVGEVAGLEADELRTTFDFVHGNAVAGHLFAVASGLESVVVGLVAVGIARVVVLPLVLGLFDRRP